MKDFTRGPTESHSNHNIEKQETHLSPQRAAKITTVASDRSSVAASERLSAGGLHSTVQSLHTVTGTAQHGTVPADTCRPFTAQYSPCTQ
jgi:hypothetical protein